MQPALAWYVAVQHLSSVVHMRAVPSALPLTNKLPSGLKSTPYTGPV